MCPTNRTVVLPTPSSPKQNYLEGRIDLVVYHFTCVVHTMRNSKRIQSHRRGHWECQRLRKCDLCGLFDTSPHFLMVQNVKQIQSSDERLHTLPSQTQCVPLRRSPICGIEEVKLFCVSNLVLPAMTLSQSTVACTNGIGLQTSQQTLALLRQACMFILTYLSKCNHQDSFLLMHYSCPTVK